MRFAKMSKCQMTISQIVKMSNDNWAKCQMTISQNVNMPKDNWPKFQNAK